MVATVGEVIAKARANPGSLTGDDITLLERWEKAQARRKPADPEQRYMVNRTLMADIMGITIRTLNKWVSSGKFPPKRGTTYDLREVCRFLRERLEAKLTSQQTPRDKMDEQKARWWEIRVGEREGEIAQRDDVVRGIGPPIRAAVHEIHGLAKRLADLACPECRKRVATEGAALCRGMIREIRQAFEAAK